MADFAPKQLLSLFKNEHAAEGGNRPQFSGFGTIDKDTLAILNERMESHGGDEIDLECAAWKKTSKQGKPYLFVTVDVKNLEYASKGGSADDEDVPF